MLQKVLKLFTILLVITFASASYNETWAKTLNAYSAITHCNEQQIKSWQCKLCKSMEKMKDQDFYYNQAASILGYSGYIQSENTILFIWRGTVNARNWVEDFTFAQVDYGGCKGCKIHEGFFLSYETVASHAKKSLQKIVQGHPSAKLVVTGSSMGAALAIVNALDFITNGYKVEELYLYGCPRVTNQNLSQYLGLKVPQIWRIIHYRDIIPHVPFREQNYHHPPFEVLYDEEMRRFRICDASGEDPTCALALEPGVSIQDHITYWYQPVKMDVCTL